MTSDTLDTLIVGGGFAGLSAALWLARYRRRARVCDDGEPRNEPTWAVHGYPGVPDMPPHALRNRIREQAASAGADLLAATVVDVSGSKDDFLARLESGAELRARRVLLAIGVRDRLPDVPGLAECYGVSAFHCPDCDGPSMADAHVGVVGSDRATANMALYLLHWARTVTLLTHGQRLELDPDARRRLDAAGVRTVEARVTALDAPAQRLRAARLDSGEAVALEGIFFHVRPDASSDLPRRIGCALDEDGYVRTDTSCETSVPGVYAAGDLAGHPHLAVSAAAQGVRAALTIHRSLLPEERQV